MEATNEIMNRRAMDLWMTVFGYEYQENHKTTDEASEKADQAAKHFVETFGVRITVTGPKDTQIVI